MIDDISFKGFKDSAFIQRMHPFIARFIILSFFFFCLTVAHAQTTTVIETKPGSNPQKITETIITTSPTGSETPTASQTATASQPLILSIQYGKGGSTQQYSINSGETVFVPTGTPADPNVQAMNPQEVKETEAYNQQLSQISDQISNKILEVQKKQFELDNEVYTVYRTPLGIQRQAMERDLKELTLRREQLTSQRTAKEAKKPVQPPQAPPPTIASGITVTPTLAGNVVILKLQAQNKKRQSVVKAPINEWVVIFTGEKGKSLDIWAKVTTSPQK